MYGNGFWADFTRNWPLGWHLIRTLSPKSEEPTVAVDANGMSDCGAGMPVAPIAGVSPVLSSPPRGFRLSFAVNSVLSAISFLERIFTHFFCAQFLFPFSISVTFAGPNQCFFFFFFDVAKVTIIHMLLI